MKIPPTYKPTPAPAPIFNFAADPFDPRMRDAAHQWSDHAVLIQIFWHLRQHLVRVCPDAVTFLENLR